MNMKLKRPSALQTVLFMAVLMIFSIPLVLSAELLPQTLPDGFKLTKPVEFYDPGNLYELINGQAIFYFSYGFVKLDHGFYEKEGVSYKVDVFEVREGLSALGCYREQKDDEAADMNVGAEGYILDYLASFYKDKYYVEIVPVETGSMADMTLLAAHIEKQIPGSTELPKEIGMFPPDGLIPDSESYIGENLLSYTFLGHGLVAKYRQADESRELSLFISLAGTEENAKKIAQEFHGKLQDSSTETLSGGISGSSGTLPYRGTAMIFTKNNYAFGCLSAVDKEAALAIISKLSEKL